MGCGDWQIARPNQANKSEQFGEYPHRLVKLSVEGGDGAAWPVYKEPLCFCNSTHHWVA